MIVQIQVNLVILCLTQISIMNTQNRYCNMKNCLANTHVFCVFTRNDWQGTCKNRPASMTDVDRQKLLDIVILYKAKIGLGKGKFLKVKNQPGPAYGLSRPFYNKELEKCANHFCKQCRSDAKFNYCCATEEFPYTNVYIATRDLNQKDLANPFGTVCYYFHLFLNDTFKVDDPRARTYDPFLLRSHVLYYKTIAMGCSWYVQYLANTKKNTITIVCVSAYYEPANRKDLLYPFKKLPGTSRKYGCMRGWFDTTDGMCTQYQYKPNNRLTSTTSTQPPFYLEPRALEYVDELADIELPTLKSTSTKTLEEKRVHHFFPVFRINRNSSEPKLFSLELLEINPEGLLTPRQTQGFSNHDTKALIKNVNEFKQEKIQDGVSNITDIFYHIGDDYTDFEQVVLPTR